MGKRKADDVPAPPSGAKKHKKRAGQKIDDPPKPIKNKFQAIDSLFEEAEAILRCPSITAHSIPATSTIRKIPDLFIKKLQTPPLSEFEERCLWVGSQWSALKCGLMCVVETYDGLVQSVID
ncbi:hypothetical protein NDU88_007521 [Pleurodeles waltl]|uniref:Uncharacterized protein n=1 Tax=Pleurodeles waltl TaxID=8319 RepID=A0AAV7LSB6_PLEWA|nr:hypothetical protein NDU88_007521 [Pleurodeles waltl]